MFPAGDRKVDGIFTGITIFTCEGSNGGFRGDLVVWEYCPGTRSRGGRYCVVVLLGIWEGVNMVFHDLVVGTCK